MKPEVYTVQACRWGNRENHSYIVGVYPKKAQAIKAAESEEEYRGGKYACEVLEWELGVGRESNHDIEPKTIRPLVPHPHFTQPKG
jgi:hypothetical protein